MSKCIATIKACQSASARLDYSFNLTREFSRLWAKNTPYAASTKVRPNEIPGTGFEYSSGGGVSNGAAEPDWPATGTVVDGSITWTAGAISNDSLLHRIASVVWTAPSDITADDQDEIDEPGQQVALIWISGGVAGEEYEIDGEITTDDGMIVVVRIELKIVA